MPPQKTVSLVLGFFFIFAGLIVSSSTLNASDVFAGIVGGVLFLTGTVFTFVAFWKQAWALISHNLSIALPALVSGLSQLLAILISKSLVDVFTLIFPFIVAITLSVFTGYQSERFGDVSSKSFLSNFKTSIVTFFIVFCTSFLLFWMFSCGISEYGCGTGTEKLMGFVFICPPLVIYAPLISLAIVSFNKIGYKWKYRG